MRETRRKPTLSPGEAHESVDGLVRSQRATSSYHASGKEALRVGLSLLPPSAGDEVLLPSYLPNGVVEAVRAAGYAPRFHPVESMLAVDADAVERNLTDETAAVLAVQYFGFPRSGLRELRETLRERGVALVDDSSHGPLSVADGRALGTFGDFGLASFHKPLDVPDGAVLYVDGDSPLVDADGSRTERERRVGAAHAGPGAEDVRYYALAAGSELSRRVPTLRAPLRRAAAAVGRLASSDAEEGPPTTPDDSTPGWRGEMTWATRRALRTTDPDRTRRTRRRIYHTWASASAEMPRVEPVFDEMPPGACPWMFPVRVDGDVDAFVDRAGSRFGGVFPWPRLPRAVRESDDYPTANRWAASVVCLPVHRRVDQAAIRRFAREEVSEKR